MRPLFAASADGLGAATLTSWLFVISAIEVRMRVRRYSCEPGFRGSLSKGMAINFPSPGWTSHSCTSPISINSKTEVGEASWMGGMGPSVYLSSGLRAGNLPPVLSLSLATSSSLSETFDSLVGIGVLFGWTGRAGSLWSGGVGWVCPVSAPWCGWVGVVKDSVCSVGGAKGISTSWFTTWGSFVPADMWQDGDDGGVRDTSLKWAGISKHGGVPLGSEGG